jgi:hypothetical protein
MSDGSFHQNGMLTVSPAIDTKVLAHILRYNVLKVPLSKGKIATEMVTLIEKRRHSGFNVYCGPRILSWQKNSM